MKKRDGIAEILATGQFPGSIIKGTRKGEHGNPHFKREHLCPTPSHRAGMTVKQSERLDKQQVEDGRRAARRTQMARRGTKRSDDEIQLSARVPTSLWAAERKKTGDHDCWKGESGKNLLKKHGLDYPT